MSTIGCRSVMHSFWVKLRKFEIVSLPAESFKRRMQICITYMKERFVLEQEET